MKNILIIGSGPSVIGQGAEFDYAGTQAALALASLGHRVVVINSNPASILTDQNIADSVYIEDINLENIVSIIRRERIDAILGNFGGQTALNMLLELHQHDIFNKYKVELLGNSIDTIEKAEDRQKFRNLLESIDEPFIDSRIVNTEEEAIEALESLDFPLIVRPAFTLGGTGGGRCRNKTEYISIVKQGLELSLVHQCLIEKDLSGIKELEFEMIQDHQGEILTVCSLENFDPVGVHTGDSIVFAPVQTLDPKVLERLELSARKIVKALGIIGSCNVQFAYDESKDLYYVIEVNPRVSRSSALASKVSNYPIAKVSAMIASGMCLKDIKQKHHPIKEYVACKMPRFPFDKFKDGNRHLGTQMKSTGEIMAFAKTLEECLYKGILSLEFKDDSIKEKSTEELLKNIERGSDLRIYEILELLSRSVSTEELFIRSKVDSQYLEAMQRILNQKEVYDQAKFYLHALNDKSYYSSVEESNLTLDKKKESVLVIGSGPIRIGQGMEFDYSSVQAIQAIQEMGYEAVIVNNNPATVSTDTSIADRLYFEPLTIERVLRVIEFENPIGVMVQFGGQTAINLAQDLEREGIVILGTQVSDMNRAEDRELFEQCLRKLNIKQAEAKLAHSAEEYLSLANELVYPVLIRPSFVIGGASMKIIKNQEDYQHEVKHLSFESPVLIDRYISGIELDLDLISDGERILIPGLMEHIEKSGVHSGDSMAVYPSQSISESLKKEIEEIAWKLAKELKIIGLMNIQMIVQNNEIYVIELNPRASRTIPFISKATNVDLSKKAARIILNESLDQNYGLVKESSLIHIKAPIFSFSKLRSVDTFLSPEMKSTGEIMASDHNINKALYKAFLSSSYKFKDGRYVLLTIADKDKHELLNLAQKIEALDYDILASEKTYNLLIQEGIAAKKIAKIGEAKEDMIWAMEHLDIDFIVNTVSNESKSFSDGFIIRRNAVEKGLPLFTSIDTAQALLAVLESRMIKPLKLGGKV